MDRQSYLSAVADLITSNYPQDKARGLKASEVGLLVRRELPRVNWTDFGFLKLKDVLAELESQGQIRTGIDAKFAYSVWIGNENNLRTSERQLMPPPTNLPRFRPLRKPIWTAFVADRPQGRRFLCKTDGMVRMGLYEDPGPGSEWVEIIPVAQDTQRAWAKDFIDQRQLDDPDGLVTTLDTDMWYHDFVTELRKRGPDDARPWLRLRSGKIVKHVQEWVEKNSVPEELVFEAQQPPERSVQVRDFGTSSDLRAGLMAALESLATDELLQLRIPARNLLAVFRPDLLGSGVKSRRQS